MEHRLISTMGEFLASSSTCSALRPHLQNGSKLNSVFLSCSKTRWALKDGKISVSERRLLWFLGVSTSIMILADLIVVIWGSVVVFSNYAWWSYTDTTSPTYCAHTPMLFAFVLLLVSWSI